MFTRDDLIDAVLRRLKAADPPASAPAAPSPVVARVRGRLFLTERDIKKALTLGALVLTIPRDAIISPLAQDWLALKGVVIVRLDQ